MSKLSVEKTGKSVDETIFEALKELKAEIDEVEIKIIDHGSRGILGIGAKPCRIIVTKKIDLEKKAQNFISDIAHAIGVTVNITTILNDNHLDISLTGKEMGVFIGKRGQTLDSLQYLTSLIINKEKGDGQYVSVVIDAENYRQRRRETLESLAYNLAKKVKLTRRSIVLEPMTPNERRIIHSALQNDKYVSTYSEGEEPYRNVVVTLKRSSKSEKKQ